MNSLWLKEYITNGHYFSDAKKWYIYKYLSPVTHRIWAFYAVLLLIFMIAALSINMNRLLPIRQTVNYGISAEDQNNAGSENARIVNMDDTQRDMSPRKFIAGNLLRSYITIRENYDYSKLDKQFLHIRNSSDRIVFKRFYDYMNIDNPDSPVIRYQKYATRTINIENIKFLSDNDVVATFQSTATDENGKIFENLSWIAHIGFKMDNIQTKLASGSKFNFMVTDYKLRIIEAK